MKNALSLQEWRNEVRSGLKEEFTETDGVIEGMLNYGEWMYDEGYSPERAVSQIVDEAVNEED